jgi:hypothetical protein
VPAAAKKSAQSINPEVQIIWPYGQIICTFREVCLEAAPQTFGCGAPRLRTANALGYSAVPDDPKISPLAVRAMIIILVTMGLVALFANIQRARRDKIETIIVTPIVTPSPTAKSQ